MTACMCAGGGGDDLGGGGGGGGGEVGEVGGGGGRACRKLMEHITAVTTSTEDSGSYNTRVWSVSTNGASTAPTEEEQWLAGHFHTYHDKHCNELECLLGGRGEL